MIKHTRHRLRIAAVGAVAAGAAAAGTVVAPPAIAAHLQTYEVHLKPLNGAGAHGKGTLVLDTNADTLQVRLEVNNVVPNETHLQHIHGFSGEDGDPADARCPGGDSRNQIEGLPEEAERPDRSLALEEGFDEYGGILLSLTPFPTPQDRDYVFEQTYTGDELNALNLDEVPLDVRHIVIHGGLVDGFDRDARPETYVATLPVACGEITEAR